MTTCTFREALPDDRDKLIAWIEAYYLFDRHEIDRELIARAVDGVYTCPDHVKAYVIEERDGETVTDIGYMTLTIGYAIEAGGKDIFIDELFLEEPYRGKGHGAVALAYGESEARRLGGAKLSLEVEKHNHHAKAIYERRGFRDHDRFLMSRFL